ncbi:MAG: nucleotide exchange factor GrpE, partial [Alteromonadaceae bacterium]
MTNESKNENGAELSPEQIVEDSIKQAEGQVEEQQVDDHVAISAEQEKINELELALVAAKSTVSDQKDSVIRAKAEVDNVRRRSAQD